MRSSKDELAITIIRTLHGEQPALVVTSLVSTPSQALKQLMTNTNLSFAQLRNALLVLMTHDYVTYTEEFSSTSSMTEVLAEHPNEAPSKTFYSVNIDRIIFRLRLSKVQFLAKKFAGHDAISIVDILMSEGRIQRQTIVEKVLSASGQGNQFSIEDKTRIEASILAGFEKLVQNSIINRHYFGGKLIRPGIETGENVKTQKKPRRKPPAGSTPNIKMPRHQSDDDVITSLSQSLLTDTSSISDDTNCFYSLNFNTIMKLLRHEQFLDAVKNLYGESLLKIFSAAINVSRASELNCKKMRIGPFVLDSVAVELADQGSLAQFSIEKLREIFDRLAVDPSKIVFHEGNLGGGSYSLNIGGVVNSLRKSVIQNFLTLRFSSKAAGRAYALLLDQQGENQIDEKVLTDMCVTSPLDMRKVIHEMVSSSFLTASMVPKSQADRNPLKASYFFSIDNDSIVSNYLEIAYESALKLWHRLHFTINQIAANQTDSSAYDFLTRIQNAITNLDETICIVDLYCS
ncbi:hypothetical protein RCL1_002131 [Eukaryota sp. TZLM3-RCL]